MPHRLYTRGFSLIEVVVSIFVIGIIIVASGVLAHTAQLSYMTRDQDVALRVASSKIETLRAAGYTPLASGSFSDALLSSLASSTASVTVSTYDTKTKRADVSVSWKPHGAATSTVLLTTLITDTSALP